MNAKKLFSILLSFSIALTATSSPATTLGDLELLHSQAELFAREQMPTSQIAESILNDENDFKTRTGIVLGAIEESNLSEGQKILKIKDLESWINAKINDRLDRRSMMRAGRMALGALFGGYQGVLATGAAGNGGPFDVLTYIFVGPIFISGGMLIGGALGSISFKKSWKSRRAEFDRDIERSCNTVIRGNVCESIFTSRHCTL